MFLTRASSEEFKDLFQVLRQNAQLQTHYLVLIVLSTSLATLGLFSNSTPVVIGAMILAPLMAPIISLSMGALRQDRKIIFNSILTISIGLLLGLASAFLITIFTPIYSPNAEILSRIRPNLLDLGIAVLSGVAGAYAYAREEIAKTLAGVAIAVALVPPLAVTGIGLAWLDLTIFTGSLLLLFTNLAGMILASSLTFLILGFSPLQLATKSLTISLLIVGLCSIPLTFGFNNMITEHNIIKSLENWELHNTTVRDVRIITNKPLTISLILVSNQTLDENALKLIKKQIETKINQTTKLEIRFAQNL